MGIRAYETINLLGDWTRSESGLYGRLAAFVLPDSLVLSSAAILLSAYTVGTPVTVNQSVSIGLYTVTGSTLTLINSASVSTALTAGNGNYLAMALSTTATLNAGLYYIMCINSSTRDATAGTLFPQFVHEYGFYIGGQSMTRMQGTLPPLGVLSTATGVTSIPASIAVSDILVPDSTSIIRPYVLLSS